MQKFITLLIFAMVFTACTDGGGGANLDDTFVVDPQTSGSTQNGLCYVDTYAPDEASINRKLDILIIPDTSGSIIEERSKIALGFDSFVNSLPEEVDYRIGVMLAHSAYSSKSGVLYQKGTEPVVLDSEAMTTEDILLDLDTKMKNPSTDNKSDGGEMGLYSLYRGLNNNLESIQFEGLLREDAALAVVFVADEQDICHEYPSHITQVPDPQGKEDSSKAEFCLDSEGNYIITPQIVLDRLKEVNGEKPLVVGAVIYNNEATIPNGGENEIGYGYKEIVELAGGITVDMADGDYGDGLTRLGVVAQASVKPENSFNLKSSNLDMASFKVTVDGAEVGYSYSAQTNQVILDEERNPFSVARVEYCEKKESPLIATQVVAGGLHTCAIYVDGKVKCWGRNNFGQLGYGNVDTYGDDETIDSIPFLDISEKVIDLSAGLFHNCAVLEGGDVLCWGANDKGQLGLGHMDNIGDDETLAGATRINLGEAAKRIYSGTKYNCALLESNNIKCWGENNFGQLGYGHTDNIGDDESLSGLNTVPVGSSIIQMDISTISNHTCAALTNGELKCWGLNNFGQLGYGHSDNIGDDESITGIASIPFSSNILQLATGSLHTCALGAGQKVRCWGRNSSGQVGLGYDDIIGDDEAANSVAAIDLSGDGSDSFSMVATGNSHTCVINANNQVHCWGLGSLGALGNGDNQNIGDDEALDLTNTKVNIAAEFTQISGGINHTCALEKSEGKVICWGQNSFGQLGLGHVDNIGDDEDPSEFVKLK
jgi:alpha-tubulin suppressor-like RCC1 family protein